MESVLLTPAALQAVRCRTGGFDLPINLLGASVTLNERGAVTRYRGLSVFNAAT